MISKNKKINWSIIARGCFIISGAKFVTVVINPIILKAEVHKDRLITARCGWKLKTHQMLTQHWGLMKIAVLKCSYFTWVASYFLHMQIMKNICLSKISPLACFFLQKWPTHDTGQMCSSVLVTWILIHFEKGSITRDAFAVSVCMLKYHVSVPMCSSYDTSWYTMWGDKHTRTNTAQCTSPLIHFGNYYRDKSHSNTKNSKEKQNTPPKLFFDSAWWCMRDTCDLFRNTLSSAKLINNWGKTVTNITHLYTYTYGYIDECGNCECEHQTQINML